MTSLAPKEIPRRPIPISVEMYHVMDDHGAFAPEERVELIDGEIFEMSPIGSRHARCVSLLNEFLVRHFSEEFIVSNQNPIELDDKSEPQPDLCVLRRVDDLYRYELPKAKDVLLLIEVSDSTVDFDRVKKLPKYASAGIPETWLIDLESEHVEVHFSPKETAYGVVKIYVRGEDAVSETMSELRLSVDSILG